jgi:hypothetical protein
LLLDVCYCWRTYEISSHVWYHYWRRHFCEVERLWKNELSLN